MKKQLAALACRRRELLGKIQAQRMDVAAISLHLRKPLALVDAGLMVARFIRSHPALVSGGVAALLAWRSKDIANQTERKRWRLLYLYPAALTFGLRHLFSAVRLPREKRKDEVDQ